MYGDRTRMLAAPTRCGSDARSTTTTAGSSRPTAAPPNNDPIVGHRSANHRRAGAGVVGVGGVRGAGPTGVRGGGSTAAAAAWAAGTCRDVSGRVWTCPDLSASCVRARAGVCVCAGVCAAARPRESSPTHSPGQTDLLALGSAALNLHSYHTHTHRHTHTH